MVHARTAKSTSAAAAVIVAVAVGACGGAHNARRGNASDANATAQSSNPPVQPNGHTIANLSTPGTPKGEQTVTIQVVATPGKEKRQALALVPVYIDGQGPLPFAVDTGASRSLIAAALARRLGLPDRGSAGELYGITGGTTAQNVMVASWRAGNVTLPPQIIAAVGQPGGPAHPQQQPHGVSGPVGLLGSDVLSRYGKIAIDYDKGLLILDPSVK